MNPIRYTSRTFESILADMNADNDLVDKPSWFKKALAGIGDTISMWNNAQANDSILGTAFTRRAVVELCRQIGYELASQKTSSGILLFHLKIGMAVPVTLAITELEAMTRGTIAASAMRFEARAAVTITALPTETVVLGSTPIAANVIPTVRTFLTGERVVFSTTIPTGLSAATIYYAIAVTGGLKVASTEANALAGTAMTISGSSGNCVITLRSVQVTCYQQKAIAAAVLHVGTGSEAWLEVDIPELNLLADTLSIVDGTGAYTVVETLATSISTDADCEVKYRSDGSAFLRFGNGTYGRMPTGNITVSYAVGGGAISTISAIGGVSVYAGVSNNVEGVTNPVAMTGGADAESIETAKRVAPGLLKSRGSFVTVNDGEVLALNYSAISLCRVISNVYGTLSAEVVAIAIGGGTLGGAGRSALQTYLISKSVLSSMDVRVVAATITTYAVTSAFHPSSGYVYASVLPYYRLAWKLLLAETGQEILDSFKANGLNSAITLLNGIFTEAFLANDLTVNSILNAFYLIGARDFGDELQSSDAISFIQVAVEGVDYMTVALPSFPITNDADEITTYGALTFSEIT